MKIIIGSANFSNKYGINKYKISSIPELKKILNYSKKNKINSIDDAISYGNTNSVFKKINTQDFKFISKIKLPKNYKLIKNLKLYFLKIIKKSLKTVEKKQYSCLLGHEVTDNKKNILLLDVLNFIKKEGLTKKIGISAYSPEEVYSILNLSKLDVVQIPFNVFDRRLISSKLINTLVKKKIEIQVRSIFLQGALLSNKTPNKLKKYNDELKDWQKWCFKKKLNKVRACVHFVKKFDKISSMIIGINDVKQLREIIKFLKEKTIDISYSNSLKNNVIIDPRKW
jgi:aryl-alcohol dehydrogenase-like predicted oxidoreductase